MSQPTPSYRFTAPIQQLGDESYMHHCLPVPPEVADDLQRRKLRRLVGTLNGHRFNLALHGRQDGERFLMLSLRILRDLRARPGEPVTVICEPDPNPDQVELCEEFMEVLIQEPEAARRFYALTPGRQRGLAYYVNSAKRVDTRISRALVMAHKLKTNTLYGDTARDR